MVTKTTKMFRIGIDARFYGPIGKGLGRYTQEIVDGITRLDTSHHYVVFLGRDNFDEFIPTNSNVTKVLADVKWYGESEQFLMPYYINQAKVDLMHFPHFNVPILCPVPFVVTIHDLIITKFPTTRATTLGSVKYFYKNLGYRIGMNHAIRRAKKIIAVSEFTKQDLLEQFKVPEKKVTVIYEGVATLERAVDQAFTAKLDPEEVLSDYCILEPYLLYVGNAYPHKNLESLVRVFLELHKTHPHLKLVLVGREDYFYARLKKFVEELTPDTESIIFPGYVPDRDLQTLFSHAAAYVFPSKYEGFGLPPLEAMARDCPVVSSNATCLPEILGEAAIYFDPYDDESMKKAILTVLSEKKVRSDLVSKGKKQISLYDWTKAAKETLAVYTDILKRNV